MLGDKIKKLFVCVTNKEYAGNRVLYGKLAIEEEVIGATWELEELIEKANRCDELEKKLAKYNTNIDIIDVGEVVVIGATCKVEELKADAELGQAIEFIRVHIDESGYTYNSVNDIMQGYKKRLENYYNSYTMNIMIDDCEESLKILYPYWYREQKED